jgi:hypothetical protein
VLKLIVQGIPASLSQFESLLSAGYKLISKMKGLIPLIQVYDLEKDFLYLIEDSKKIDTEHVDEEKNSEPESLLQPTGTLW